MKNKQVIFDLDELRIGFAPSDCSYTYLINTNSTDISLSQEIDVIPDVKNVSNEEEIHNNETEEIEIPDIDLNTTYSNITEQIEDLTTNNETETPVEENNNKDTEEDNDSTDIKEDNNLEIEEHIPNDVNEIETVDKNGELRLMIIVVLVVSVVAIVALILICIKRHRAHKPKKAYITMDENKPQAVTVNKTEIEDRQITVTIDN